MASISRFVAKDCRLRPCDAVYRPSTCSTPRRSQTHLRLRRGGFCVPENDRILAIQNKPRGPIVALSTLSSIIQPSRNSVLCKAATNVPGDFSSSSPGGMSHYERIIETLTTLFPVWVTWLIFIVGLGFLMLSMGLTLTFEDFR